MERKTENLKLNYQFDEKDVPQIFQTLVNGKMNELKKILLDLNDSSSFLEFDGLHIRFEEKTDNSTVTYGQVNETIETGDPEKSIIDHLCFVLKNGDTKLKRLEIVAVRDPDTGNRRFQKMNSNKLNKLLQSMIDSIDHQIQTTNFIHGSFNENTFFPLLTMSNLENRNLSFLILHGGMKDTI